jgi:hypothetical protein
MDDDTSRMKKQFAWARRDFAAFLKRLKTSRRATNPRMWRKTNRHLWVMIAAHKRRIWDDFMKSEFDAGRIILSGIDGPEENVVDRLEWV